MSVRPIRSKTAVPVADLAVQLAGLVDALVHEVTARVAAAHPAVVAATPRAAYSVKDFAAALDLAKDTVYREMHAGRIAHVKIAGEYRIPHSEIERLTAEASERRTA